MTDRIDLAGIEVLAKHGVYPEEKERLQPFIVDVTAHLDLAPAGRSDDLADTLDYGALASEIEKVVASESHQLIERVAQTVAETVLSHEIVDRVEVTIHKPEAPVEVSLRDISVTIERSR
ncbi:MAG: dihydroneopterin aldolase [Acidimicrobiales bacterium]|nr:dihydroneopterin aldolase [Acidimicrobiales bacterium]HLV90813.1 dihydroneopterin aldolase [Acidimicrobiia bacterium]